MKKIFLIPLILLWVGGAVFHYVWVRGQGWESTDNAQVEGDVIPISAEVSGRIEKLGIADNQRVKKGELLVEIDRSDYLLRVQQAEKALASAQQRHKAAQAQLALTERQARAAVSEKESGVAVNQAGISTATANLAASQQRHREALAAVSASQAQVARSKTSIDVAVVEHRRVADDLNRYQALYARDEISRQQLEAIAAQERQAKSRVEAARREVQGAQAQVVQAQAGAAEAAEGIEVSQSQIAVAESRVSEAAAILESARTAPEQIAVAAAQVKVIAAEVEQAKASLALAQQDLSRTRVVAPRDGIVSKRSAQVGGFVQRGTPLLALVAQDQLWVVANLKETQMEKIRAGLKAEIRIDTYPKDVIEGHVESLQAGTGSKFSLLPPENASGNFVKVVQRVPVKIVIDSPSREERPLLPGMSAGVRVRLP